MAGGHTRNNPLGGGVQTQNINQNVNAGNAPIVQRGNSVNLPIIKEPKEADILAKFKYKQLDKIDDEPNPPSSRSHDDRWRAAREPGSRRFGGGGRTDTKASSCGTQPTYSVRECRT